MMKLISAMAFLKRMIPEIINQGTLLLFAFRVPVFLGLFEGLDELGFLP